MGHVEIEKACGAGLSCGGVKSTVLCLHVACGSHYANAAVDRNPSKNLSSQSLGKNSAFCRGFW